MPLHRPLGASGLDVSVLALGSWRTYERISRAQGAAVLEAARAPIPTGYSEVVFGEVFRASGWPRDEVIPSAKEAEPGVALAGEPVRRDAPHRERPRPRTFVAERRLGRRGSSSAGCGSERWVGVWGRACPPPTRSRTATWRRRSPSAARRWWPRTTPAAIAVAFALANPRVATVLFGATRPEQVDENRRAVDLLETLGAERLRAL